jgi:hypothetical protein
MNTPNTTESPSTCTCGDSCGCGSSDVPVGADAGSTQAESVTRKCECGC